MTVGRLNPKQVVRYESTSLSYFQTRSCECPARGFLLSEYHFFLGSEFPGSGSLLPADVDFLLSITTDRSQAHWQERLRLQPPTFLPGYLIFSRGDRFHLCPDGFGW